MGYFFFFVSNPNCNSSNKSRQTEPTSSSQLDLTIRKVLTNFIGLSSDTGCNMRRYLPYIRNWWVNHSLLAVLLCHFTSQRFSYFKPKYGTDQKLIYVFHWWSLKIYRQSQPKLSCTYKLQEAFLCAHELNQTWPTQGQNQGKYKHCLPKKEKRSKNLSVSSPSAVLYFI